MDGVKTSIPHTKAFMEHQTFKNIKHMKRINDPTLDGVEPGRTIRILN